MKRALILLPLLALLLSGCNAAQNRAIANRTTTRGEAIFRRAPVVREVERVLPASLRAPKSVGNHSGWHWQSTARVPGIEIGANPDLLSQIKVGVELKTLDVWGKTMSDVVVRPDDQSWRNDLYWRNLPRTDTERRADDALTVPDGRLPGDAGWTTPDGQSAVSPALPAVPNPSNAIA
ncbi:MAG: hypothetical protein GXX99_02670 [Clostridiales bacterium]|nr:hypothetical protein [Clostridiales bacterium]